MDIIKYLQDPKVTLRLAINVFKFRKDLEKLNLTQLADLRHYAKDKYERAANFSTKSSIITITIVPVFLFFNTYFNSYFNYGLGILSDKYSSKVNKQSISNELQKDFDNLSEHIMDTYLYVALIVLLIVFIALFIRRICVSVNNKLFNLIEEIYENKLKREDEFQYNYRQLRKFLAMNWKVCSQTLYSDGLEILIKSPDLKEAEFFIFYEVEHIKKVELILDA
ncbi:hypothetical protein MOB65_05195 [Bacillus inaquosorum]|uniref:hypothetical protein n=1 Tax=Bacillus inaquosorum TaxID=483913 RepID=UPI00227EDF7C|nr:hypothetical protein [Bacillus inaquosorum]MCY7908305.1 hypothetical protein [Bacillus inaquosorum]